MPSFEPIGAVPISGLLAPAATAIEGLTPLAVVVSVSGMGTQRAYVASLGAVSVDVEVSGVDSNFLFREIPIRIGAVADADKYTPTWQLLMGRPRQLLLAGGNLIAFTPPPNDEYHIVVDVVRNAPVPVAPTDVLQVGQDAYEAILDLAQHIALFKEGPGQLEQAQALLTRAASVAGVELTLQQASQPSRRPLLQQTRVDEQSTARELPLAEVE